MGGWIDSIKTDARSLRVAISGFQLICFRVFGVMCKCASFFGRAGFARQGYREKRMLKDHRAFHVPSFVLRSMMSGQYWPEGDEVYHAEIVVPTLLVHGMHDRFVHVEDDQQMTEVSYSQSVDQ